MKKILLGLIMLIIGAFSVYSLVNSSWVPGIIGLVVLALVGLVLLGKSEEKKEAAENLLKVDEKGSHGRISEDGNLNFEQAKQVRDEMRKNYIPDDISLEINAAADLMLNKDFEGSIRAYERVMEKYPEVKGTSLGQIGAAEFFLGNYEKALEKYIESKNCGADNDMTEDNIWEVCEVLYKQKNAQEYIEKYIDLYPQGRYIKKSKKLLPIS